MPYMRLCVQSLFAKTLWHCIVESNIAAIANYKFGAESSIVLRAKTSMCGLTGFFDLGKGYSALPSKAELEGMTHALTHRGPDDSGVFYDSNEGIGLGHRRLSIRDLSPLGAQPMRSSCGRFWIIYNGEIYSNKEILKELATCGRIPKGTSDTELLVESFGEWGIEKTLEKLNGMFAIAAYDVREKILHLVRDRVGIKPLYWGCIDGKVIFSSELKSFGALRFWRPEIDRNSLASFMRHNYIPAPHTIYQNVFKLEPGTRVIAKRASEPTIIRYWNFIKIAERGVETPQKSSAEEIVSNLEKLLLDSVRRRMVSDVPIGALLSGGIDSSTVSALMAENSIDRKINTFSIGFSEKGYDEAPFAKAIAQHLGTDHTELYAKSSDALDLIEKMPAIYDEPFADSSQIPTALVSLLTKQYVTVVLSGDGGDELFAGYNRYTIGYEMAKQLNRAPTYIRQTFGRILSFIPESLLTQAGHSLPGKLRINQLGHKIKKLADVATKQDLDAMYRSMISHWHEPSDVVIGSQEYKGILWGNTVRQAFPNFLDRMQALDTITYLPDDILTKVDRASMAVGLEARVPLLDHRVIEYAWQIPRELKVHKGVSKWPLREILYKRVPKHLIDRPKMGFGVPIDTWLRGPLKHWGEDLLEEQKLVEQNFFNTDLIRQRWNQHQNGENWAYPLWNVLMFQSWAQHQKRINK